MLNYFAAILQDRRYFDTSNFQLSDDGSYDGTIVGDDDRSSIWSFTTTTSQDFKFKFKLKRKDISFAPIQNDDIVELAHANDEYLYIRSTRNDEKYESILKKVNWNKN